MAVEEDLDARSKVLRTTLAEVSARQEELRSDGEVEDCCVICLDIISEKAKAIPCNHESFDFLCLTSWLQEQKTCPLCKAEVVTVHYNFDAEQKYQSYTVPPLPQPATILSQASRRNALPRSANRRRPFVPRSTQTTNDPLSRRRYIYRNNLYSLHVGSNRLSRFRDLTPELFSRDAELVSRARRWIRRELQVFEFLGGSSSEEAQPRQARNAEFLLEYIVAILKTVDTQGSGGQAEDMISDFLGRDNTRLFLHEMRAWLRSPYTNLEDWDRHVQYDGPGKQSPDVHQARYGGEQRSSFSRNSRRGQLGANGRYSPYDARVRPTPREAQRRYNPD